MAVKKLTYFCFIKSNRFQNCGSMPRFNKSRLKGVQNYINKNYKYNVTKILLNDKNINS